VGLTVSVAERRPLPPCATFRLNTAAWEHADIQATGPRPTLRERQADTLVGCGRLPALPITDLVRLLGPPPSGTLGHPGYDAWTYPLAFVPGLPGVPRSVLTIAFGTQLVTQAAIVRFGATASSPPEPPKGTGVLSGAPPGRRPPAVPPGAAIPGAAGAGR